MSLNDDYKNSVQVFFDTLKSEIISASNILENFWKPREFKGAKDSVTTLGAIQSQGITAANTSRFLDGDEFRDRTVRTTDQAVFDPTWRRRMSRRQGRQVAIPLSRTIAQSVGMGQERMLDLYKNRVMADYARGVLEMMLRSFTATYRENPVVGARVEDAPIDGIRRDVSPDPFSYVIYRVRRTVQGAPNAPDGGSVAANGALVPPTNWSETRPTPANNQTVWVSTYSFDPLEIELPTILGSVWSTPVTLANYNPPVRPAAGREIPFSNGYRHMIAGTFTVSPKTFSAPLTAAGLLFIDAEISNAREAGYVNFADYAAPTPPRDIVGQTTESRKDFPHLYTGVDVRLGDVGAPDERLVILSHSGFAMFQETNMAELGSLSQFATPYDLAGARCYKWKHFVFITVPDVMMRSLETGRDGERPGRTIGTQSGNVAFNDAITFPSPDSWKFANRGLLDAVKRVETANPRAFLENRSDRHALTRNLEIGFIVDKRAMHYSIPAELNIASIKDFLTRSFETYLYREWYLDSIRVYDPLVRKVYFTRSGEESGTYK